MKSYAKRRKAVLLSPFALFQLYTSFLFPISVVLSQYVERKKCFCLLPHRCCFTIFSALSMACIEPVLMDQSFIGVLVNQKETKRKSLKK